MKFSEREQKYLNKLCRKFPLDQVDLESVYQRLHTYRILYEDAALETCEDELKWWLRHCGAHLNFLSRWVTPSSDFAKCEVIRWYTMIQILEATRGR